MTENGLEIHRLTCMITGYLWKLCGLLHKELSRPDKSIDVVYDGVNYNFNPATTKEDKKKQRRLRKKLFNKLLRASFKSMLDTINSEYDFDNTDHWKVICALVSGEDPADHQFEIIKEEIVSNLDENGKPIAAKPLNMNNVLVQWQDESKFKFEDCRKRGFDV